MSHFVMFALLPPDTTEDTIEPQLNALMERYSEEREVPPHKESCWCVGREARNAARDHANAVADLAPVREQFQAEIDEALKDDERLARIRKELDYDPMGSTLSEEDYEYSWNGARAAVSKAKDHDRRWAAAVAKLEGAEAAFLAERNDRDAPDPECDECRGSGEYETTCNPEGYWDWWVIGGRWNGTLLGDEYKISEDENSYQRCSMCQGTGKRDDELARQERLKHPGYSCNVCRGTGREMIFASRLPSPPAGGNFRPVREIPDSVPVPYAVLTPDGEWHQQGEMMMFGMSKDDMPEEDWAAKVRAIYGDYQDHLAVVVDCHT